MYKSRIGSRQAQGAAPQLVLPVGFGLIAYRYSLFAGKGLWLALRGGKPS